MSGHIRYEISKSHFGRVRLLPADKKSADTAYVQTVTKALSACLDAKITYKRKGLFGPKIIQITYGGQTMAIDQSQGELRFELLEVDDEARETILELMRQSPLFIQT